MRYKRFKFMPTLVVITLMVSVITSSLLIGPFIRLGSANPGDVSDSYYNSTTLNVTVLENEPRVLWFDFQYNNSGTWESKKDAQIDVNESAEYRFIVNVSTDLEWANITYVNVTAWYDGGSDASAYNDSTGGNKNLFFVYDNTSGADSFSLSWPDDEVQKVDADCTLNSASDPNGAEAFTEARNLTFAFIPSYQFRYAPDPGSTGDAYNDPWSWNFNITATATGGYLSYDSPSYGDSIGEFGVYSYTEIVSAGWPSVLGSVGEMGYTNGTGGSGNISITTRTNGNYSFSVNVTNLTHDETGSNWIENTSIYVAGGNLTLSNFDGANPLYFYGGAASYIFARNNSNSMDTDPVQYAVDVPMAQFPGDYTATIFYHLKTETY